MSPQKVHMHVITSERLDSETNQMVLWFLLQIWGMDGLTMIQSILTKILIRWMVRIKNSRTAVAS